MPGAIYPEVPEIRKADDFQAAGLDPLYVPQGWFPGYIVDAGRVLQHVKIAGIERAEVRHGTTSMLNEHSLGKPIMPNGHL